MSPFSAPVLATGGSADPAAPLVVLLHGRGSNERDIIGLAGSLTAGPAYAAVRAPIAASSGRASGVSSSDTSRPAASTATVVLAATRRTWPTSPAPQAWPISTDAPTPMPITSDTRKKITGKNTLAAAMASMPIIWPR